MMYSVQCMCLGWRAAHLKSVRGVGYDVQCTVYVSWLACSTPEECSWSGL